MRRGVHTIAALGALGASLMLSSCGSEDTSTTSDPCPSGICGSGGSAGSGGTTGGTNGTTTAGTGGGPGGGGPGGAGGGFPCAEAWGCTPWETDGTNDIGTRVCTDFAKCGTTNDKPLESTTLPALDLDYYKCKVEPIFNRGCAHQGCHGTEEGRAFRTYARGRLRITGETWVEPGCLSAGTQFPSEKCIGSIECGCWTLPHSQKEWQRNFDSARGFGLTPQGAPIPAGMEATSDLLAQPVFGGKAHTGVHLFQMADADYTTLEDWLSGKKLGMTCVTDN